MVVGYTVLPGRFIDIPQVLYDAAESKLLDDVGRGLIAFGQQAPLSYRQAKGQTHAPKPAGYVPSHARPKKKKVAKVKPDKPLSPPGTAPQAEVQKSSRSTRVRRASEG
jgi:hypothetical protein